MFFSKFTRKVTGPNFYRGTKESECRQTAQGFASMTQMFGMPLHSGGMRLACECYDTREEAVKSYEEYILDFYEKHEPAKATAEHVKALVQKYNEDEDGDGLGEMIYRLYKKYGGKGRKLAKSHAQFTDVRDEL